MSNHSAFDPMQALNPTSFVEESVDPDVAARRLSHRADRPFHGATRREVRRPQRDRAGPEWNRPDRDVVAIRRLDAGQGRRALRRLGDQVVELAAERFAAERLAGQPGRE